MWNLKKSTVLFKFVLWVLKISAVCVCHRRFMLILYSGALENQAHNCEAAANKKAKYNAA